MATSNHRASNVNFPEYTEAERSILGAILLDNNALNATPFEKLKPEDFFHDHHRPHLPTDDCPRRDATGH